MTPQTVTVLSVMVDEPDQAHYGLAIARETGLKAGTSHQGRPRRRYHRLNKDGEQAARRAIVGARAASQPRTAQS